MMKIKVIIGSTRQGRFGDKPAKWIFDQAKKKAEVETELLDLRDYPLPFFDEPISPSMIEEPYKNEVVQKWTEKIEEADGFIIVTPEYNHGYSAVLKNALDYVYKGWNSKPVGFVSYGGSAGGTRAVQQLRQVVIELQMVPIRNGIHFYMYWSMLDEKGELKAESFTESAEGFLNQLILWAKNLKKIREEKAS